MRLEQVLLNLTSNAVKFTADGEVALDVDILESSDREVALRFTVRDTGIGLNREQADQLFQAFHQTDASITRKYGGTGLGLAISKGLIEMMGSDIQVKSKPGIGSQFTFTARFGKSEMNIPARLETLSMDRVSELLTGSRILLVEDNEVNLQVASELLQQVGVEVAIAKNGREAVDLAAKERFDCILMDLQMPVMDGLAATREIRKGPAPPDLPILAMTANAMAGVREECVAAGMNDHIVKPIKPAKLYQTLIRRLKPHDSLDFSAVDAKPSSAAEKKLIKFFSCLYGIDTRAGLGAVNGDPTLYLKVLRKACRRSRDIVNQIQAELIVKNFEAAQRLAHSFKGTTGIIGAKKLQEISLELESALSREELEQIPKLMDSLSREARPVTAALEDFFKKNDQKPANEFQKIVDSESLDADTLKKLFGNLSELIDDGDSDALDLVGEIKNLLEPSNVSDDFLGLETHIKAYKFEKAKETLIRISKEMDLDS